MNLYDMSYIPNNGNKISNFENTSLDALDHAIRRIMTEDQASGPTRYGDGSDPFPDHIQLGEGGFWQGKFKPLCSYKTIVNQNNGSSRDFGAIETLMTWERQRDGTTKLVYLQDYLFDMYWSQVLTLRDSEISEWLDDGGSAKELPAPFQERVEAEIARETKRLLKEGLLAYFPSAQAAMPKTIRFHEDLQQFQVTDLNVQPPNEQIEEPWFMGLGIFTDLVLFVSQSAREKEAAYKQHLEIQSKFGTSEKVKEIERVSADNIDSMRKEKVIEDLLEKDPDEDVIDECDMITLNQRIAKRENRRELFLEKCQARSDAVIQAKQIAEEARANAQEIEQQQKEAKLAEKKINEKTNSCLSKMKEVEQKEQLFDVYFAMKSTDEMQTERAKLHINSLPDQANLSLENANSKLKALTEEDMSLINLCCTLSAPFTRGTAIKGLLDTSEDYGSVTNNPLCVVEGIFKDCIATEPGREKLIDPKIREDIFGTTLKDGRKLATRVVTDYQKGNADSLSQHIENGISTIQLMLQSASVEEINDPSSGCGMAIKSLSKVVDFVDSHEEVKNHLANSMNIMAHARGWREFSEICTHSQQQQVEYLSGDHKLDKENRQKLCGDISAELNLKKMCKDTMWSKKQDPPSKGETYWQDTTNRSKVAMGNYRAVGGQFPFIVALGIDPKLIEPLRQQPVWEKAESGQELSKKDVLKYIYQDLPEKLQKVDPYQEKGMDWKQGVKLLSKEIMEKQTQMNKAVASTQVVAPAQVAPAQVAPPQNVVQSTIKSVESPSVSPPKKVADSMGM